MNINISKEQLDQVKAWQAHQEGLLKEFGHLLKPYGEEPMATKATEMRLGAVIVFKKEISEEKAKELLKVLEPVVSYVEGPVQYDANNGGPVWYIP